MTRPKPIVKIKRNVNSTPSSLETGELGVDLGKNVLYIGNTENIPIPIAAEVSPDATLGGISPSDNKTVTEKAISNYFTGTSNFLGNQTYQYDTLNAYRGRWPLYNNINFPNYPIEYIDLGGITIERSSTGISDIKLDALTRGFLRDGAESPSENMILNVSYSVKISRLNTQSDPPPLETEGGGFFWRTFGLRLTKIDLNEPNTFLEPQYYAMQVVPPAIGTTNYPLPTLISGNAIINLPKSDYTANPQYEWIIQMVYQLRTADPALTAGEDSSNTLDPPIAPNYDVRLQITKLAEYD